MLAISAQPCSLGWMLDNPIMRLHHDEDNYMINSSFCKERINETSSESNIHHLHSPNSSRNDFHENGDKITTKTKKLNHNASERDRRKRINNLYADLRNLLPSDDHSRKLSIPATISRVLKYIPELQKQVQKLILNKETLISKAQESSSLKFNKHKIKPIKYSAVSATQISDTEIIIQSSIPKSDQKGSFSEAIFRLENEGFIIMNASCFESMEGRLFCNFHIQAQEGGQVIDAEKLKRKCGLQFRGLIFIDEIIEVFN